MIRIWECKINKRSFRSVDFLFVRKAMDLSCETNLVYYLTEECCLLVQGDRTDKRDTSAFNTWKDIIIPGNVDDGMTKRGLTLVQPLPLSKRKYLANYLGRAQGKVGRLQLIELANQYPDKVCWFMCLRNYLDKGILYIKLYVMI